MEQFRALYNKILHYFLLNCATNLRIQWFGTIGGSWKSPTNLRNECRWAKNSVPSLLIGIFTSLVFPTRILFPMRNIGKIPQILSHYLSDPDNSTQHQYVLWLWGIYKLVQSIKSRETTIASSVKSYCEAAFTLRSGTFYNVRQPS